MRSSSLKILARNVRALRIRRHLTQEAVATGAGLTQNYISLLESASDRIHPTLNTVDAIAHALDVPSQSLLGATPLQTPIPSRDEINQLLDQVREDDYTLVYQLLVTITAPRSSRSKRPR